MTSDLPTQLLLQLSLEWTNDVCCLVAPFVLVFGGWWVVRLCIADLRQRKAARRERRRRRNRCPEECGYRPQGQHHQHLPRMRYQHPRQSNLIGTRKRCGSPESQWLLPHPETVILSDVKRDTIMGAADSKTLNIFPI
jgi:hypothetical protein